jgi:pimeloyl-ACP methyl ester carboxylesterase
VVDDHHPEVILRSRDPHLRYHAFVPSGQRSLPPLVLVHGRARTAAAHFRAFLPAAMRLDLPLIAPLFPAKRFAQYQTLGGAEGPLAALVALESTLEDASHSLGLITDLVNLFGFSGGAQFAHRYTMLEPSRVVGLVAAAAGWYTCLDPCHAFPRGSAPSPVSAGLPVHAEAFLQRRVHVLVGERDVRRDDQLRVRPWLDRSQGEHRLSRGRRWVEHLAEQAKARGRAVRASLGVLPDTDHSFTTAVGSGGLVEKTLAFLHPESSTASCPTTDTREMVP